MADDYIPFEKALEELQMSEEELKRLVSEAEIQAIREGDGKIRLRVEDVNSIRDREAMAEELVFADDDLDDDTGMVTAVLEEDSLLEEEDTLDLDADDLEVDDMIPTPSARPGSTNGGIRSRGRAANLRSDDKAEGEEGNLDRALIVVSTLILVYAFFVAHSIVKGESTQLTEWLANMFR